MKNAPLFARFVTGIMMQGIVWWFEHDTPEPEVMTTSVMHLLQHGLPSAFLSETNES